jgi:G3E family GTPase
MRTMAGTASTGPVPVTVLTGALGSGKTTLLRRLLTAETDARIAVVINEFGEVGLDHLLVRNVTENAVVLQNGCICCTIRSDLQASFRELIDGRASGAIEPFDRVVLETTGLADPAPIVQTLVADPLLRHHMRLAGIVCTADALHARQQAETQPEAMQQLAIADALVVTKTDMPGAPSFAEVRRTLARLNPIAEVTDANAPAFDVRRLLDDRRTSRSGAAQDWLQRLSAQPDAHVAEHHGSHGHTGVASFVFRTDGHVDWTAFGVWLTAFAHRYGEQILRIKGLLNVPEAPGPIVLDVVRGVIHHPVHLESWPDPDRSSRIVFILQDLDCSRVANALRGFLADAGSGSAGGDARACA